MTTDIATRRNSGMAPSAPSSAVAIRADQSEFNDKQRAALVAMGVSEKATRAELAVFFHQCQKLRLDPFQKQIYFIHRRTKEGDKWVEKPTTQIGIDGFRVARDRIEQERGLSVSYEDTIWYASDGQGYDVWLWDEPPAACKFVVLVDDGTRVRRFPSVLRFNEYCQKNREGDRLGRWRDGHAHQIEKCAEADALRRAFPNDLSGAILTDAAPLDDPEAPPERQRVTAEQARARRPQQVPSEVVKVVPPEEAPWAADVQVQPEPETAPEHHWRDGDPRNGVIAQLSRLGVTSTQGQVDWAVKVTGAALASLEGMNHKQASDMTALLARCQSVDDIEALLATGEVRDEA